MSCGRCVMLLHLRAQDLAGHPMSEACRDLKTKADVLAACRSGAPRTYRSCTRARPVRVPERLHQQCRFPHGDTLAQVAPRLYVPETDVASPGNQRQGTRTLALRCAY